VRQAGWLFRKLKEANHETYKIAILASVLAVVLGFGVTVLGARGREWG